MKKLIIALLLSFACTFSVFAQQTLTVSGTVKDDAGEPLIGVVVAVAGAESWSVAPVKRRLSVVVIPVTTASESISVLVESTKSTFSAAGLVTLV